MKLHENFKLYKDSITTTEQLKNQNLLVRCQFD
jgi:hypothetical protein